MEYGKYYRLAIHLQKSSYDDQRQSRHPLEADATADKKTRSIDCLKSKHGRALEFPDVYLILGAYSAKIIRALFTHVRGLPTHLQASTKYIN